MNVCEICMHILKKNKTTAVYPTMSPSDESGDEDKSISFPPCYM